MGHALESLTAEVSGHAQEVVALASAYARTDDRVFIQNLGAATIHVARSNDDLRTICGWRYSGTRTRPLHTINNIPGTMLCEVCLKTERAIAEARLAVDLSDDEA